MLLAVSSGLLVFGQRGLLDLHRLRTQSVALERDNAELRARNARLSRRIDALRNDNETIERMARERLGMVKEGEVVYYLPREAAGGAVPGSPAGPGAAGRHP